MKIGIIGAPGSGKTELADALAKEFDLTVIDNYAERWSERTKLTIGFTGGYAHTLGINLDRIYDEQEAKDNFVTCGTLLDGLMYMAMMSLANPNEVEFVRAKAYIEMMSMLYFDFWQYDIALVSKLTADPPKEEESAEYLQAQYEYEKSLTYDAEMPESIKSFKTIKPIFLPVEGKIEAAIEEVKNVLDK